MGAMNEEKSWLGRRRVQKKGKEEGAREVGLCCISIYVLYSDVM